MAGGADREEGEHTPSRRRAHVARRVAGRLSSAPGGAALAEEIVIETRGRRLYEVTDRVARAVAASGVGDGLCVVFVRHTSASLVIQENADPSARRDLEAWLERLVPENDPLYTHTSEGPDDMPSHVKAALTATSLSIPVVDGRLALGTWQGIYLWEHRTRPHRRRLVVQTLGSG